MSGAAVFAATGRRPPRPRAKTGSPFTLARLELLKVRGSSFWWMAAGHDGLAGLRAWAGMAFMKRAGSPVPALRSAALADGEVYQVVSLLAPILAALLTSRIAVLETSERMNLTWLSFGQSDAARFVGKLIGRRHRRGALLPDPVAVGADRGEGPWLHGGRLVRRAGVGAGPDRLPVRDGHERGPADVLDDDRQAGHRPGSGRHRRRAGLRPGCDEQTRAWLAVPGRPRVRPRARSSDPWMRAATPRCCSPRARGWPWPPRPWRSSAGRWSAWSWSR
ncbi:membrane protein [Bifidobacterium breve]|nr:membrane protein [Bifidobacterium breve]